MVGAKMKKPKVSIILPSLNVFDYIAECIDSVRHQTLQDIEIICVDAGSTDGTQNILRKCEKADERIRVIITDRKSYGYQMNLGMRASRGEYIGIVETDDLVSSEMYEELYVVAKKNDADFVKADFFQFTGSGDARKLTMVPLTAKESYYGRMINIEEEPECLSFNMVTWSGIYKKSFLVENEIRYNETPGASYQDNGFWFQTFMYAKRAFFIHKPYYMLRRDNPASSIYDKKKIYCICEEYQFILDILLRDLKRFESFKYYYAYYCYQSYIWNLMRIDQQDQKDFLMIFSKDMQKLSELGMLNRDFYHEKSWNNIVSIIRNPIEWYENNIGLREKALDAICAYDNIIIYGAGMVGKKLFRQLEMRGKRDDILCFAVSKVSDPATGYAGISIKELKSLAVDHREDAVVVVAVNNMYQDEMADYAKRLKFRNIKIMPVTDL